MDRAVLDDAIDRAPVNDDGRSGATLERVVLADGSRLVVKRFDPATDVVMRLSGDTRGRGVLTMRDLGDAVLSWTSVVAPGEAGTMFDALAALHAAYLGSPPAGLLPSSSCSARSNPPGCGRTPAWTSSTPPCADGSTGPRSRGPAEVDIGRLLAGCAHLFGTGFDGLLALQSRTAGPSYDEDALRLGLLTGLTWLAWNKALDVVEHPDPAVRDRERAALGWWLRQAELALGARNI